MCNRCRQFGQSRRQVQEESAHYAARWGRQAFQLATAKFVQERRCRPDCLATRHADRNAGVVKHFDHQAVMRGQFKIMTLVIEDGWLNGIGIIGQA